MKVVKKAKAEVEILASVNKNADKKMVQQSIKEKNDSCVVHLCGCRASKS